YILRDGEYMPILLALPPTSLRPYSDFINACFVTRRRPTYASVVQIGLKRVEGANTYSVATFKKVCDFTGEELAKVKAYATGFREQIKGMLQARAADPILFPKTKFIKKGEFATIKAVIPLNNKANDIQP
ncbi:MAG: hypothetical protein II223_06670, partial [Treponema sp.]|nr:hypothetical protein [Treponema sp.]